MLAAFREIYKYDFRYKKMLLKQELTFLELEKQIQKDNVGWKYEDFICYYEKSGELYKDMLFAGQRRKLEKKIKEDYV